MQEKRKHKRLPVKMKLEVSNLFKQEGISLDNLDAQIEVVDISKSGLGFTSESKLPIHYYFNATIKFDYSSEIILAVLKILRSDAISPTTYRYGCEFVGLPSMYDHLFDRYGESCE